MKKIISVFATIAMVATMFTSVVNAAADVTFAAAGAKNTYDISSNKNVMVKVTIEAPAGFAGFKNIIDYDEEAFTYVSVSKSADLSALLEASDKDGEVAFVYASGSDHMPTKMVFNEETFEDEEVACSYYYQIRFMAKDTTENGEYDFTLTNDAPNLNNAAGNQLTGEVLSSAKITITGGVDPAPSIVEAKIAANDSIDGDKVEKEDGNTYFTKGLSATLTPGTETVTKVIATLFNKAGKEGNEKAEWEGTYKGETPITFFINVLNVPDGEDVTATWDIVK